jgi:ribosome-binding factor A
MHERRAQRVAEALREELAELIAFELSDPRLGAVDVTEVQVSPDSRHAHVKVGLGGQMPEQKDTLAALDHARHYLRHELARRLNLRRAPELHFAADPGMGAGARIDLLLTRARKKCGSAENQP